MKKSGRSMAAVKKVKAAKKAMEKLGGMKPKKAKTVRKAMEKLGGMKPKRVKAARRALKKLGGKELAKAVKMRKMKKAIKKLGGLNLAGVKRAGGLGRVLKDPGAGLAGIRKRAGRSKAARRLWMNSAKTKRSFRKFLEALKKSIPAVKRRLSDGAELMKAGTVKTAAGFGSLLER